MPGVLIVDDSNVVRTRLRNFFTQNKIEIAGEATNGAEAIAMYEKLKPDFVTMDIVMPGITGIEAVQKIIAEDKDAKIIMISSEGQEKMVFTAIQNGALHFLVKPFSTEQLTKIVTNLLHNENPEIDADVNLSEALILAIDDSKTSLALLKKYFHDFGFSLITAEDGKTGIEFARSGNPDLLLLDLEMPDMSGFEVMEKLKENSITASIPVIIISSHTQKDYIHNAMQYGIVDYISKNTDKDVLKNKITTALRYSQFSKMKQSKDSEKFITIVRREKQSIVHFKRSLSLEAALAQQNEILSDTFIKQCKDDYLVFDICALVEMTVKDLERFVELVKMFGERQIYVVAGRHYGTIVKHENIEESVQFFITRGDLIIFLSSLD
jgi:two-component system chemotaxis response regulator CheY